MPVPFEIEWIYLRCTWTTSSLFRTEWNWWTGSNGNYQTSLRCSIWGSWNSWFESVSRLERREHENKPAQIHRWSPAELWHGLLQAGCDADGTEPEIVKEEARRRITYYMFEVPWHWLRDWILDISILDQYPAIYFKYMELLSHGWLGSKQQYRCHQRRQSAPLGVKLPVTRFGSIIFLTNL